MNTNRRIGAFDFFVAGIVHVIDGQLGRGRINWKYCLKGINYTVEEVGSSERRIRVVPVDWKDDNFIFFRAFLMDSQNDIWRAREGTISARHIPAFDLPIVFKFHHGAPSFITTSTNSETGLIIMRTAAEIRPDLNMSEY